MRTSAECLTESPFVRARRRLPGRNVWLAALALLAACLSFPALALRFDGGLQHTCLRTATGGAQCVGGNAAGELGNGTTLNSNTPVEVTGLGSGVTDVAVGGQPGFLSFSCALTNSGGVKCWGAEISNGSNAQQSTPVIVPGLASGVTAIAAGGGHACALTGTGGVKCWGDNAFGQLGDGTTTFTSIPVDVVGLASGVTAIAAGGNHTCAALAAGIKCWGANANGQLGNSTTTGSSTPVDVAAFATGVRSIAGGAAHTCAVTTAGALKCWGNNFSGEVGDGTGLQRTAPVDVTGLGTGVLEVVAGNSFSCALTDAGEIKCWGSNFSGEMGDGTRFNRFAPNPVSNLQGGVTGIAVGSSHACASLDTGAIRCWGANDKGQFGNDTNTSRLQPTDVSGLGSGIAAVAADRDSSCALTTGGGVKCWGRNEFSGQLGDGTTINRLTPVDVSGLTSGVSAITVGGRHACALMTATNGVKCWGRNAEGQVGNGGFGGTQNVAADVTGMTSGVDAIAAGFTHTCAVLSGGGVKCWGDNSNRQLGDGTTTNRNLPTDVSGLTSGVTAIAAGFQHSCAVITGGGVKCWGSNGNGRLGDGTTTNSAIPVDVVGLSAVASAVGTGTAHSCARTTAGGIKCWGRNFYFELGNGGISDSPQPVDVIGLSSNVAQLAVGRSNSCVLTNAGAVRCWGYNGEGALGDGTFLSRSTPAIVPALGTDVAQLGEFGLHACAVTTGGAVKCWGQNFFGQIGDGTNYGVLIAVDSLLTFATTEGSGLVQAPPLPPPPPSSGLAGSSVGVAPGMVVLGAPQSDVGGQTAGQVFVYSDPDFAQNVGEPPSESEAKSGFVRKALTDINIATLQVTGALSGDKFGQVAVSRDRATVVVGAPGVSANRGAVYVFKRPVGGWIDTVAPSQTIVPPDSLTGDGVGATVEMTNAGTVLVGAPGAIVSNFPGAGKVFVLRPVGDGNYTVAETLTSPQPQFGAEFGAAIDGDGAEAVIGIPNQTVADEAERGAVVTFREPTTGGPYATRDLIVDLSGRLGDKFGTSVAISDGTLVVGAPGHDNPTADDAGAAMIYDQSSSGAMEPAAILTQPDAEAGAALGTTVAVQDQTIVAAAPLADVNGNIDQGAVAVYVPSAPEQPFIGVIAPTAILFDPYGEAGDQYGTDFALDDSLAAAGIPFHESEVVQPFSVPKASAGTVAPGQAILYTDDVMFRDGLESPRGLVDGCVAPDLAIPDNTTTGVNSSITLNATGDVRDLNVYVRIAHPFASDLRLTLTHIPTARTLPLYEPAGACPTANIDADFDDQALDGYARTQCSAIAPAVAGVRLPNDWLLRMQGAGRAGPWRLTVADVKALDSGALQQWCVDAR